MEATTAAEDELADAIAEAEAVENAAGALRDRKDWGEELRTLEDLARLARTRVAEIRRRILGPGSLRQRIARRIVGQPLPPHQVQPGSQAHKR